jgi:hypothetical protein
VIGNYSVFSSAFLIGLIQPEKEMFTAEELYICMVTQSIAGKSNQAPEYGTIRNSVQENCSFIPICKK